jgi:hypothetical protein
VPRLRCRQIVEGPGADLLEKHKWDDLPDGVGLPRIQRRPRERQRSDKAQFLARRGRPFVMVDANALIPGLFGIFFAKGTGEIF